MATVTVQNDQVATFPLIFTNVVGATVSPVPGGTVGTSDPSVASASLAPDSSSVALAPAAGTLGSCTLTYTNGPLSCTVTVQYVADTTAVAVSFGNPVFTPVTPPAA